MTDWMPSMAITPSMALSTVLVSIPRKESSGQEKRVSLCCTAAPIANVFKTTFWILTFVGADGEPPINIFYSAPESLKSRGYPSGQGWLSPLMLGVAPSPPILVTLN